MLTSFNNQSRELIVPAHLQAAVFSTQANLDTDTQAQPNTQGNLNSSGSLSLVVQDSPALDTITHTFYSPIFKMKANSLGMIQHGLFKDFATQPRFKLPFIKVVKYYKCKVVGKDGLPVYKWLPEALYNELKALNLDATKSGDKEVETITKDELLFTSESPLMVYGVVNRKTYVLRFETSSNNLFGTNWRLYCMVCDQLFTSHDQLPIFHETHQPINVNLFLNIMHEN